MNSFRFFSTAAGNETKGLLAALRKKTGFTLINCRKALECNDNDLAKAEIWLKKEAKRLSWEKALKLQDRVASQGLIAITRTKNKVAMAEVNCETDFVARNEKFKALAETIASVCISYPVSDSEINMKKVLLSKDLADLVTPEKEKLSDYTAKKIGEFGENIVLRRAMIYQVDGNTELDIGVHPPNADEKEILTGRYGAFVACEKIPGSSAEENETSEEFGKNLCTHIIAMSPSSIGSFEKPTNEDVPDESSSKEDESSSKEDESSSKEDESSSKENESSSEEDESSSEEGESTESVVFSSELVNQDFVLDDTIKIGDMLLEKGKKVIDFHRFECGENLDVKSESDEEEADDSNESEKVKGSREN